VNKDNAAFETSDDSPKVNSHKSTGSKIDLDESSQDLNFQTKKSPKAKPVTFDSDLKVDLPDDIKFVDITSPSSENTPQSSIDAMMPSEHFEPESIASSEAAAQSETLANTLDEDFIPSQPSASRPERADIGTMRLDVARISADIQSGEELYRRAQQRIENLTNFVERAEVDFSMLNRLEPENRRLKARNRTIQREIEANIQKMNVLRADLEDREHRLAEKTRIYESTLGKLSSAQKSVQEYERALNKTRGSSDRNALKSERLQTSLDVERRENEVLRNRLSETLTEMESQKTSYIEAKKVADSLAQDCSDFRQQAETAEKDADTLRKDLTAASREDEMTAMQQQVALLTKQLEIKDEILKNAARDVQELRKVRTAQDLERERLEAHIETQAFQLDQANSDLVKSRQDVTDFDRRYRDVATALSVAQTRRMSSEPSEAPDIQPNPTVQRAEGATFEDDALSDLPSALIQLFARQTSPFPLVGALHRMTVESGLFRVAPSIG